MFSYFFVGIHNLNCCRMVCTIIKQSTYALSSFRQFQFNFKFAINMKQNNDETLESQKQKRLSQIYFGVKTEDFKSSKKVLNFRKSGKFVDN